MMTGKVLTATGRGSFPPDAYVLKYHTVKLIPLFNLFINCIPVISAHLILPIKRYSFEQLKFSNDWFV